MVPFGREEVHLKKRDITRISEHLQTNLIGLFENLHITYTYFLHKGGGGH